MPIFSKVHGVPGVRGAGGRDRNGRWEAIDTWDDGSIGYTLCVNAQGGFEVFFEEDSADGDVLLYSSVWDGEYEADQFDHVTGISAR